MPAKWRRFDDKQIVAAAKLLIQLGRLSVEPEKLAEAVVASGFLELPIRLHHAVAVAKLPALHRDPFERLLIAQAISEPLHLLTADAQLEPYSALVHRV